MAFQFKPNSKFALLALDGIYSDLPDIEFQLADATWVMPGMPSVADLGIWKEWVGTLRADSLQRANLVLIRDEESNNPFILDEAHTKLRNDLSLLFYFLHFRPGIECSGSNEPDLLCGSCIDGKPMIRQMNKLPAFYQSKGYTQAPITGEWLKEALALRSSAKTIESRNTEFRRLTRGLNVLFSGLRETGQGRLHQLVRSLEALILPNVGSTKNQFVHRCQTFAKAGPDAQLALKEAFDMRSDTEHLHDWNRAVQNYASSEQEDVCLQRTRQLEALTFYAYTRVLLDPIIREHFRTDDTLSQFWKLADDQKRMIWGTPLDISVEPRYTTYDNWGRAVV
jgi:hypothetical protein